MAKGEMTVKIDVQNMDKVKEVLKQATDEIEFYKDRDGKASFQFMYDDGVNPFNIADINIVDYGVSDNIYSLSCDLFQKTFEANKQLQTALKVKELEANELMERIAELEGE